MKPELFLCVHGHFYQPPRENPWTEEIELQKSAGVFHDWNERIHHECYLPNARARVLDEEGRLTDIVNNFEAMSFNFGPTLISWLHDKHPETYRSILDADRLSIERHGGHGNAIAQVYNHVIMPLATRRDKVTQVKWGLADFKRRFNRDAESVWLAEAAVNGETLEVLAGEGVKFIVLGPSQAEAVRPITGGDWRDVSHEQIDPKEPYRIFLGKDPQRHIDVFFYDGPISKAIGFEDVLSDARRFMDRIQQAVDHSRRGPQLIASATDGETFGHHKAFGDRVFAYLSCVEAPRRGFKIVNFAEHLAAHPPRFEARLKTGENGEGTSWSCPHGLRRWKDHCGCRGGGPSHWTQHWRKPLREALDWLRTELSALFETRGGDYLKDPWEARNDYIHVVLDRSEVNVGRFFARHGKRPLSREEITVCLKLLEMQRHAMLMYTSCGWFFTDISGIETVQILQYAARALELAEQVSGKSVESGFLEALAEAKSNVAEFRSGRGVYERFVRPSVTSPSKIAAHYAILSIFEGHSDRFRMYCYRLEVMRRRVESYANLTMGWGRVRMVSEITLEESDLVFIVLQIGTYDFRCSVKPASEAGDLDELERELFEGLHTGHMVELLRTVDSRFGRDYYDLKDLFLAERQKVLSILSKEAIQKIQEAHAELYDESRRMNEIYRSINLPIPEEVRYAASLTLSERVQAEIRGLAAAGFRGVRSDSLQQMIEGAKRIDVELKLQDTAAFLSEELRKRTSRLLGEVRGEWVEEALNIDAAANKIGLEIDKRAAQDDLFSLFRTWKEKPGHFAHLEAGVMEGLFRLASAVDINPKDFKRSHQKV